MKKLLPPKIYSFITIFYLPLFVLSSIIISSLVAVWTKNTLISHVIVVIGISIGSVPLVKDTLRSLKNKDLALDYIAILAILVALTQQQYLVAAVIVLMLAGGKTLEEYGTVRAKQSLTSLAHRIPSSVHLWEKNQISQKVPIASVKIGQQIVIRKGEVIPLDGTIASEKAVIDESSLTGEAIPIDKSKNDIVRSGTVNIGDVLIISVSAIDKDSTYRKIIQMVEEAQSQKSPIIRLADRYSALFTILTLSIAVCAYLVSRDFQRVLAVLVIATPCPLILATPIALMGGMSSAARKRIIIKRLASLEILSKIKVIVFDKTGTITLGKPTITKLEILDPAFSEQNIWQIAESIERNSLHPLAQAITLESKKHIKTFLIATDIQETIGKGISGIINKQQFSLSKLPQTEGIKIQLLKNTKQIAIFWLEDTIKTSSKDIIAKLRLLQLHLHMFTGDKASVAHTLVKQLGKHIHIKADLSPKEKRDGILQLKKQGYVTAMVGDGINDAPALAAADVGMVFSNHEQTASTEAADIVFLSGDFQSVLESIYIGKRTITIALQSILFGIGLSTLGMILASLGIIHPLVGAMIQELIDILVIINALRASREIPLL